MKDKLVIIDGNSLVFRAYYGLPSLLGKQGEPCNAIFGFCKMLINVIQKINPKYIIIAFDAGKHTFRHNLFADYKGTRRPTPDDLRCQLDPLKNLLRAMNMKVVEMPEIEADDLIGSASKKFDCEKILVSGDRDLLQLIDNDTKVWLTMKGISDILEVDETVLKEKFFIEPYQVVEKKAIMGDSADNIPGVKGIGEKTALKLISEYNNLDNIYANIDNIKGNVQKLLNEQKDNAYLSKTLATIKTDVELDFDIESCKYDFPFNKTVYEVMESLSFKTIISKNEYFQNFEKVEKRAHNFEQVSILAMEDFTKVVEDIKQEKIFAVHVAENISLGVGNKEYLIDNFLTYNPEFFPNLGELLADENIEKVMFDVKAIKHYFKNFNLTINNYFDISLAIYIANELEGVFDYEKFQEEKGFDKRFSACNLLILKNELSSLLKERDQWDLYCNIELKLVEVLYEMEKNGIKVDIDEIKSLSAKYRAELEEITKKILFLAGKEFNINSPKQLQQVLFEDLKLVYKGKKSTNVDVLEAIQDQHEIVPLILRFRKISKLLSTYLEGMIPYIDKKTNKVHTTFMQSFTTTGRLSSREPNLQNIPVRDDESKILRKLFVSSFENGNIMSADYNQIELRLMAILSEDANLLNDFNHKVDIHSMTASKIFNISPDSVSSTQRRMAKAVNFGIIYGISEYGLAKNISTTAKEAKEFIAKYFELYPGVKEYMNKCVDFAKTNGYAKTIFNRIRHIPEINSTNFMIRTFGERIALNMPLQGSASDIIKLAMIKVQQKIKEYNLKSKLILQIHDELIIDVFPGEENVCEKILVEEMASVVDFKLPLAVACSYGKTWFDTK